MTKGEIILDFDVFFERHPTPMFIASAENRRVLAWNEACQKLSGPDHFSSQKFTSLFPSLSTIDWYLDQEKIFEVRLSSGMRCTLTYNAKPVLFQEQSCFLFTVKDSVDALSTEQSLHDFHEAITQSSIVSIADRFGTITYVNENFVSISGYSATELIGKKHSIINSRHHPKFFWVDMWKTISSGKIWRAEVRNRTKNGNYYWVDTFIMPFLDKDGKVREYLSIRIDITQRKQQEEEIIQLNKSLSTFQLAIDTSSIVSRADKQGSIIYVNKKFEEISGYTCGELIGRSHNIVNSGHHSKAFWIQMWRTISSGKTWRAEVRNRAKDGSFYWVDTFIMPMVNEAGQVYEYLSIRNDITTRKEQEKILEQNEEQFRVLVQRMDLAVNASGLGVWHGDFVNMTLQGNERIREIYGIEQNQISLEEFWSLVHPEDRDKKKQSDLNQITETLSEFSSEYRVIRPSDGKVRYLRSQGIFFRSAKGKTVAGISVVYDMTRDKEHEQNLLNSILEKETLIKEIHHRVKNNLQLISSMFFFKVMSTGEAIIPIDFMNTMRDKIKSVSLIHERLLQTEQLDSIEMKDYLEHLLRDIINSHQSTHQELLLNTEIEDVLFTTDKATYLGQLVNELVLNAIKHAFRGMAQGKIKVSLKKIGEKHRLQVEDNGIGIPVTIDPMKSPTYGMQLIFVFVKQLKGELTIDRKSATRFQIDF